MSTLIWILAFLLAWAGLCLLLLGWQPPDPTLILAGLLIALIAVAMLYRWRGEEKFLSMLTRGGFVLLPILLVALIPITLVTQYGEMDVRLRQGALAGLILVSGWLAAFLFQEERKQRDRDDRRQDVLTALQSEIFNILTKIDNQAIHKNAKDQQTLMRNGALGPFAYVPFSTSESPSIVFDAVSGSIPVLEPQTIRPVLRFYSEYTDLRTLVEDMRGQDYRELVAERRIAIHQELTRRRIVTLKRGLRALFAVNLALGMTEDEAAKIRRSGLNPSITHVGKSA